MKQQAVNHIKQAILKDFRKSRRNIELHRTQMSDTSSSPEYRQAARKALEEWSAKCSARG